MKRLFYLYVFMVFAMCSLQAQYLMGDFNFWTNEDLMQESYSYYSVTVDVATDLPTGQFLIDQLADASVTWGDATDSYSATMNTSEGQMRGSNSGDSPVTFSMDFSAGKYYTFRIEGDETWWNRKFVVMETDAIPVEINSVLDNSSTENENNITVSITTSATLSTQVALYIRYTADGWSTSSIVACTGAGTDYSGIIPGESASTEVEYYVFTSAMESTFVSNNPDFSTLKGNNNGGTNYTYTVVSALAYAVASVSSDLIENSLDGSVMDIEIFNETLEDATIDLGNITLNNAPSGLTIFDVSYIDANNFSITLDFDDTDFISDITDFSISISADELSGTEPLTTNDLTIYAFVITEDFYLAKIATYEGGADDVFYNDIDFDSHDFGAMNASSSLFLKSGQAFAWKLTSGDIVSAKMFYRVYKNGDVPGSFIEQILNWESETVSNDTTYQVWWNDPPEETDLNILESVTAGTYYVEIYFEVENGESEILLRDNDGANYIAQFTYEEIANLDAVPASELNSSSLDGMTIDLILDNESFIDDIISESNVNLINAPAGLSILSISYTASTEIELTLEYTGGTIDTQIDDFAVSIDALELTGGQTLTSNNMIIYADVEHEAIYMCKVSMWEGSGDDTWYDEVDFDGHDFGSFNSEMSLYFKTGQVFSWQDDLGDIVSAAMNYRIYIDGDTPGVFVNVDLPYYSEWESGDNTDKLWWNDSPDEIDLNLVDGIEEGTYHIEVYYEAETGGGETVYSNNEGTNYIASFTYTTNPILIAVPAEELTEENLNGIEITLNITEDYFADAIIDPANFTLNNAPVLTEIANLTYVGPYEVTLELSFDGTNFDTDITNFSISVAAIEINTGVDLTSNNLTITAIDENITINSHLLTTNNFQRYLGDNGSYLIEMEIGQLEWDGAQIGFGESATVPDAWDWSNAEWYEDGEDDNKRVNSLITVLNEVGVVFYAGRVRNTESGTWFYANSTDWNDANALDAIYTIETLDLPAIESASANELDGTRINLDWTPNAMFSNVIVLAKATDVIMTAPIQGTTYSVGEIIDGAEVIYKGSSISFMHIGLQNNTTYNYKIYTINNDYYSTSMDASASTDDSEGCTFDLNLGEDINVCGGSSVLIDSELILEPYGDTITIIFNTTEFPEFAVLDKIYMHAGVQIAGGTEWDYVFGNWGEDDDIGLMTQVDADNWSITFNPLEYFSYPVGSDLQGINLVFRNVDAELIAQNPDTEEDFYIDMSITPPVSSHETVITDFDQSDIIEILWSNGETTPAISVSTAGEYSIIATDRLGCVAKDTVNVELHSLPYVELGEDQTVCGESEIILDAGEFESYEWNVDSISQTITVTEAGVYIVTVTDEFGCTGFDIVNVELVDMPEAEFSYEFTDDMEVYFSDSSENAVTYSWDFDGDGSEDSNFAGDVSYTYSEIGQFAASLTVSNQCAEDTYSTIIYVLDIETNEVFKVEIFPNPTSEILNIKLPENKNDFQIQLYSVEGKLIYMSKNSGVNNLTIDVSEYSSGIYTLILISNNYKSENKIIIK